MEEQKSSKSVLEGVLVADLTQALAGPYLGMLLGDLGADERNERYGRLERSPLSVRLRMG